MHCVSTNDDASRHINHLQRSLAVDDDVAIAEEGKGLTVAIIVVVCVPANEHQAEAALIVRRLGGESVGGCGR